MKSVMPRTPPNARANVLVRSAADVLGGGGAFTVLVRSADVLFGEGGGLLGRGALTVLGRGGLVVLSRGGFIELGGGSLVVLGGGALVAPCGGGGLIAGSISVELTITTSPYTCSDEAGSEPRHLKAKASTADVPAKSSRRKLNMNRLPRSLR